jgi:hypothetical protein
MSPQHSASLLTSLNKQCYSKKYPTILRLNEFACIHYMLVAKFNYIIKLFSLFKFVITLFIKTKL